jgi:putative membrane-bound dehydrogenase-like protein
MFALLLLLSGADSFLSPQQSLKAITLPAGFRAELVAAEPNLVKPIALTTDERGRLWVVESHSYPNWIRDGKPGKDRVLILTPQKDGSYTTKVFLDNGTNLSGIALGYGGVWLCASPNLLFIPIKDEQPAGPAKVLLDGWSLDAKHNVFNSLIWGPDGWLYGCNGILATSHVGKPGTAKKDRTAMNCGVWRYHPTRHTFEPVAWGTTNPWGLDFNSEGEMFITNCVIKHVFHVVPGAHFVRMYGQDLKAHRYTLIESIAEHIHWGGGAWTSSRGGKGIHDKAGGGHAHAGALFYLGGKWPKEYHDQLFMCNIHGNRLNRDAIERKGSGYLAKRAPDFLFANDEWFRGLIVSASHDGQMYVVDWHDTGECHNYDKTHPSGRIYKIVHGEQSHEGVNLKAKTDAELVALLDQNNEWLARQAAQQLRERKATGNLAGETIAALEKRLKGEDRRAALRALWLLRSWVPVREPATLLKTIAATRDPVLRRWEVRLGFHHDHPAWPAEARAKLAEAIRSEKDAGVRLAYASALQRLTPHDRLEPGIALTRHDDQADAYLPAMVWYGIEPVASAQPGVAAAKLPQLGWSLVRQHLARRLAAMAEGTRGPLEELTQVLQTSDDAAVQRDILLGMGQALAGRARLLPPKGWGAVYSRLGQSSDSEVRRRVMQLSLLFGEAVAERDLAEWARNPKADPGDRAFALETLLDTGSPAHYPLTVQMLDDTLLRRQAIRGLARFQDKAIPKLLLDRYPRWDAQTREDAIGTLASRPTYALALLAAVEAKTVPRADISAYWARQMVALKDPEVNKRLEAVWGTIRPASKDRDMLMRKYKGLAIAEGDRSRGRLLYARTCASCHKMFGEGGAIGPELTGSQRRNPEYILTKVLDPNATVPREHQTTLLRTSQGRVLTGVIKNDDGKVLLVQTPSEEIRIRVKDVESREPQKTSLMPENQLKDWPDADVRDLLAYLAGDDQPPLPAGAK